MAPEKGNARSGAALSALVRALARRRQVALAALRATRGRQRNPVRGAPLPGAARAPSKPCLLPVLQPHAAPPRAQASPARCARHASMSR